MFYLLTKTYSLKIEKPAWEVTGFSWKKLEYLKKHNYSKHVLQSPSS